MGALRNGQLTPQLKEAIRAAYHNKCQYCDSYGANEIEHIVPKCKGGKDTLDNLTLACRRCNGMKSGLSLPEPYAGILLARAKDRVEKIMAAVYTMAALEGKMERVNHPNGNITLVWISKKPTHHEALRYNNAVELAIVGA